MNADFAVRLRNTRADRGLKRADVARDAGLAPGVYGRYERGERLPTVDTARAIADAVGVSLDYLTGAHHEVLDPDTTRRILAVQDLDPAKQQHVFALLDAFVRDDRVNKALVHL